MGNSYSDPFYEQPQVLRTSEDPRYGGLIQVVRFSDSSLGVCTTLRLNHSETQIQRMRQVISKRSKLSHPNFSTIVKHVIKPEGGLCGTGFAMKMYFEYFDYDLAKQIEKRSQCVPMNYFTEEQICSIAGQLNDCLVYIAQNNCHHGDIQPKNVFIDRYGKLRLFDTYFTNFGKTGFQLAYSSSKIVWYLSPSQLNTIRRGMYADPNQNKVMNQIFQLGMLVLELSSLKLGTELYESNYMKLRDQELFNRVRMVEKSGRYSAEFFEMLRGLLDVNESARWSSFQVAQHPCINKNKNKKVAFDKISVSQKRGSRVSIESTDARDRDIHDILSP